MNADLQKREEEFQYYWEMYWHTADAKTQNMAWDKMFMLVINCCHNLAAKKLTGVTLDPDEFENRYMDAAMYVMEDIKKGRRPQKLSSYCYLRVYKYLYDAKNQAYDRTLKVDFSDKTTEATLLKDYYQYL